MCYWSRAGRWPAQNVSGVGSGKAAMVTDQIIGPMLVVDQQRRTFQWGGGRMSSDPSEINDVDRMSHMREHHAVVAESTDITKYQKKKTCKRRAASLPHGECRRATSRVLEGKPLATREEKLMSQSRRFHKGRYEAARAWPLWNG